MIAAKMSALMLAATIQTDHGQTPPHLYSASVRDPASVISPFGASTSFTLSLLDLESRSVYQKLFTPSSANADQISVNVGGANFTTLELVLPDPAAQVAELRRLSGLTWAQISELFDVSKRAPFHWAEGKPLLPEHQRQLADTLSAIRYVDRGSSHENRMLLFSPASEGRTYFDLLKQRELEVFKTGAGIGVERLQLPARLTPEAAAFNAPPRLGEEVEANRIFVGEEFATPRNSKLRRVIVTRRTSSAGSS